MSSYGLKSPHVSCLYYLYSNGPLTAKELVELCDEDKSAISRSLEFLKKKGLVKNDIHDGKCYKTAFLLTEEGAKTGKFVADKINSILNEVGESLSKEEREICYRSLDVICKDLQEICAKY